MEIILHGGADEAGISGKTIYFSEKSLLSEGLLKMLERWYSDSSSERIRKWTSQFLSHSTCPECNGYRLKKESLHFKIDNRHIGEIAHLDLDELAHWLKDLPDRLNDKQKTIGMEVLKEIGKIGRASCREGGRKTE